jgi:hypothetical protein
VARSTGPILVTGGLTLINQSVIQNKPVDWRIPVATGLTAGALALVERVSEPFAVGLAYIALITVLFVRLDKNTATPAESLVAFTRGNK